MELMLFALFAAKSCLVRDYFFDGSQSRNGNGSRSTPFNTLEAIGSLRGQYSPETGNFNGPLVLSHSGADGYPITIGAYGNQLAPKPEVKARDQLNTVILKITSNVVVQDLNITNPGDNMVLGRIGLVVQRNRLYGIGGDSVVVHGHVNAHLHNNVVVGFNRGSQFPNSGAWTANSDVTLFQYNTVSGGNSISAGKKIRIREKFRRERAVFLPISLSGVKLFARKSGLNC
ncbi:hypothetical protein OIDMADRAFT_177063 [Oidiodendron maius Zn]|uniref:Uncharacterized protein n=1 Tax=Oidiodendron maius (strain Zn) TaxID=913774 RepID=A0A0C3D0C6_OIDMZ|nr:hypothetical protein OIDMADRAFT_177063 [Oidiodendron maius Zn]